MNIHSQARTTPKIRQEIKDFRIIRIGLSGLDLPLHYQLGMHIQHAVEKLDRRCVFIASGDLSHRLKADGPYGFHPNGPLYDQRIMEILAGGTFKEILTMDPEIVEGAGECGHRSFAKGGRLWGSANNEDWNETQAAEWRSASLWGLWSEVGAPWAAQG